MVSPTENWIRRERNDVSHGEWLRIDASLSIVRRSAFNRWRGSLMFEIQRSWRSQYSKGRGLESWSCLWPFGALSWIGLRFVSFSCCSVLFRWHEFDRKWKSKCYILYRKNGPLHWLSCWALIIYRWCICSKKVRVRTQFTHWGVDE